MSRVDAQVSGGDITLEFESRLSASASQVWDWITSWRGICTETMPWFRMTAPRGLRTLGDLRFQPGVPMLRSHILLFGFLPIDRSDLTLLALDPGTGFVEQSPMRSMRLWRHERRIVQASTGEIRLIDRLQFRPRRLHRLTAWFVRTVFQHRHEVLRAQFNRR